MWIKTVHDEYVNTDNTACIEYDGKSDTTYAIDRFGQSYALCKGDYSMDIIQNIISGTKIMEVR